MLPASRPSKRAHLLTVLLALLVAPAAPVVDDGLNVAPVRPTRRRVHDDDRALASSAHLLGAVMGLVFTLVGIIIVFKVGAATLPTILFSIGDIVNAFTNGTVNDTTGDAILSIAGLVVAVMAVLGLLFLFVEAAFTAGGHRE